MTNKSANFEVNRYCWLIKCEIKSNVCLWPQLVDMLFTQQAQGCELLATVYIIQMHTFDSSLPQTFPIRCHHTIQSFLGPMASIKNIKLFNFMFIEMRSLVGQVYTNLVTYSHHKLIYDVGVFSLNHINFLCRESIYQKDIS